MDARTATRKFEVTPCVMLVALGDAQAEVCARVMKPLTAGRPLTVMRVAHIRAACERMLVTRPLVVLHAETLGAEDRRLLKERAQDISASVVTVPAQLDEARLRELLVEALRAATDTI